MPNPTTSSILRSRAAALALAAAVLLVPGGAAFADDVLPTGTTPDATTPTTPTPSPTPAVDPLTLTLEKPATEADLSWTTPPALEEEHKASVRIQGTTDGQLTYHAAFLQDVTSCPTSPLYPRQIATGSRLTVTPVPGTGTAATPAAGTVDLTFSITPKDSGWQRLCAWAVASPASSEASTRGTRVDVAVNVASRPAELSVTTPDAVRSGDYFTAALSGKTAASGRRALIMADPDKGQDCSAMRKSTSKKRALQTVVGVAGGSFTKSAKLRFKGKTAGAYRLCVQIVEASDRNPEAVYSKVVTVTEQMKCVATQTALAQRRADLELIRKRRDSARATVAATRKKAAPARRRVAAMRKASNRRIASARRAVRKAKSSSGRRKASRRLATVRRNEQRKLYRAGAPLRKLDAQIRYQERSYKQYRTGANLLQQTITRTQKDAKKYCANP